MEELYHTNTLADDATLLENVESAYVSMGTLAGSLGQPRRIYRVPQHLGGRKNRHVYDPVVLSLGPYHHGKCQYRKSEEMKEELLNKFVSDNIAKDPTKDREFFHKEILDRIKEIRDNYEHEGVVKYNDETLAEIILRDACFIVSYIENLFETNDKIVVCLGRSMALFMSQDYYFFENQIPLWIIEHFLDLSLGENKADELVCQQLSLHCFGDFHRLKELPWKDNEEHPPLHLLEALRAVNLEREATNEATTERKHRILTRIFKGMKIQKTISIRNVNAFTRLNLPFRSVNFMKSLLESPNDVKQLQENGIIFSDLTSDEEVVKVYKQINTYGLDDYGSFANVKHQIDEHCSSKAKTWIAEFIHNYCHSPWTGIALFAAIFLLYLTFLQAYYTIRP